MYGHRPVGHDEDSLGLRGLHSTASDQRPRRAATLGPWPLQLQTRRCAARLGLALGRPRRDTMARMSEGTLPFRGYRTWYRVVGELPARSGGLPVLVLHGGPGFPHDYLE